MVIIAGGCGDGEDVRMVNRANYCCIAPWFSSKCFIAKRCVEAKG